MNLELKTRAREDIQYWIKHDRKKALKIFKLLDDITRHPFEGIGKPESLKENYKGCWSRRIDNEHRLIYQVKRERVIILMCRYHYL